MITVALIILGFEVAIIMSMYEHHCQHIGRQDLSFSSFIQEEWKMVFVMLVVINVVLIALDQVGLKPSHLS